VCSQRKTTGFDADDEVMRFVMAGADAFNMLGDTPFGQQSWLAIWRKEGTNQRAAAYTVLG